MNVPKEFQSDFDSFPSVLRKLLDAELAAGNEIAEFGHGFPAPPAGVYIKLAKPLISRPRASGGGIDFYDRNFPDFSGEITDGKRFFFLLAPPHPPEPEPDMDAIRAARYPSSAVVQAEPPKRPNRSSKTRRSSEKEPPAESTPPTVAPKTAVELSQDSMIIDYEKWHEGIGYDLSLMKSATTEELVKIEELLVSRPVTDWRDVEALAALDSPRAPLLLRKTLQSGNRELATAVTQHAPDLVSEHERVAPLVAALEGTDIYGGLTQALLEVEDFHPPKVIDALLRGTLERSGENAVHFAAMLMFVHGKAYSSFDWDQRPFFLKFHTENRAEREAMFRELCKKIGVNPEKY